MAHEDIGALIASALDELERQPDARRDGRSSPHAQHILDEYAALVRDVEREEVDRSVEVELAIPAVPVLPRTRPAAPRTSVVSKVLARLKR